MISAFTPHRQRFSGFPCCRLVCSCSHVQAYVSCPGGGLGQKATTKGRSLPITRVFISNMAVCDQFFDFEVITLNCQGLRNSAHRDTLFSWLQCCHVDVLCLQDTHAISTQEFTAWLATASSDGLNKVGYKCVSPPGANCSAGVAILYHPEFDMISWSSDQSGRFVPVRISQVGSAFANL